MNSIYNQEMQVLEDPKPQSAQRTELSKKQVVETVLNSIGADWLFFDNNEIVYRPDLLIKISGNRLFYGTQKCAKCILDTTRNESSVNVKITSKSLNHFLESVAIAQHGDMDI